MIDFAIGYLIFLFIITVHECAHAWMADRCGDPTARLMGRLTLDPRPHIDLFGTVLIPLSPLIFGILGGGAGFPGGFAFFGWAKPVPVNPLKVRRWRIDNILISFAGCASGFLVALLAAVLLRAIGVAFPSRPAALAACVSVLMRMGMLGIWLSIFNLLPVPPLDGYHIATTALHVDEAKSAAFLRGSGPWLLLFLINTPILYAILGPIDALCRAAFYAVAGI